jgi:hypothetical protein
MCKHCISSVGDPARALSRLLLGEGVSGPCVITSTTDRVNTFSAGKEYYAIQATCNDKSIYRIEAYGEEAIELRSVAIFHLASNGQAQLIEPIAHECRHEFCHSERTKNKNYKCDLHCSF